MAAQSAFSLPALDELHAQMSTILEGVESTSGSAFLQMASQMNGFTESIMAAQSALYIPALDELHAQMSTILEGVESTSGSAFLQMALQMNDFTESIMAAQSAFYIPALDELRVQISAIVEGVESSTGSAFLQMASPLHDLQESIIAAQFAENELNNLRCEILETKFTDELLWLIKEERFEYGIDTKADTLVRQQMNINAFATREWLNSIFVRYFDNHRILIGVLRIVARFDFEEFGLMGLTMAMSALSHRNTEVKECGVRVLEGWKSPASIRILENLDVTPRWLQEYIDAVVDDLKEEIRAPICS